MEKNYYDILEIRIDATQAEIKSAFRKLARKWHPDVAGNSLDIVMKFKEINEAYEILSDTNKRKKYDMLRGILNKTSSVPKEEKTKSETSSKTTEHDKKTYENNKENSQNNKKSSNNSTKNTFQNAWDNFIKNTTNNDSQKQNKYSASKINGTDITSDIIITISEAIQGTTRAVNILHTEPCPKCKGRKFANGSICQTCKGTGELSTQKKISVKIPEHVKQGAKIRIAGEGNQGLNGGKNGDLYLIVKIDTENQPFKYEGLNILQTVSVQPFEAVLGSTIEVKTLTGTISMKLMCGTRNGQKYRLAKQGLEKNEKIGDMIITISIDIPANLSKEEVLLYEKLKQASTQNIREIINE